MLSYARCIAIFLGMSMATIGFATTEKLTGPAPEAAPALDPGMNMSQVIALLQKQQQELAEQRKLLQQQAQQIHSLRGELDVLRAPTPPVTGNESIAMKESQARPEPTAEKTPQSAAQQQRQAGKEVAKAQIDDPTKALLSDFVGAWQLPGTDAALRIGGFVKTDIVYNFDPLEIADRFIVGSIPVGQSNLSGSEAESSITANQSRLNFDLREPTDVGILRAFIEGDFAGGGNGDGSGDNFRLRHAFGQWNRILAGKTWSAFMDTDASPEEVDFEGLNGRINVRQAQVRLMPRRGAEYGLELSLEDPNPEVQDGQGVTRAPDVVVAGRFKPNDRLHMKVALIGRQIRAEAEPGFGTGVSKQYAWGTSISGRFVTPYFDKRDSLMFQFNTGDGIGRYVNDLSSVGSYDGIFDPATGNLQLFDVMAGYVSWQHWWPARNSLRSNFTFGYVDVNNPGFVPGDAYKRTFRLSSNLFWTPTPRIDMGAEYLWGRRENENGAEGDATQIQFMARYRF